MIIKDFYREWTETQDGCDYKVVIGTADEIKAVYNSIRRAELKETRHNLGWSHCNPPKYNSSRFYGIYIDLEDKYYGIMNEHAILDTLISEGVLS